MNIKVHVYFKGVCSLDYEYVQYRRKVEYDIFLVESRRYEAGKGEVRMPHMRGQPSNCRVLCVYPDFRLGLCPRLENPTRRKQIELFQSLPCRENYKKKS